MAHVHINVPRYSYFIVRTRRRGAKKYDIVSKHQSEAAARRAFGNLFKKRGHWFRADLCAWQDYYGLTRLLEAKQ
jgi:hypothetical protein